MGCDIHLYVERRENGKWTLVREQVPNEEFGECYDPHGTQLISQYSPSGKHVNVFYNHRNYNFFAILANVRNRRGCAEMSTRQGFKPISMPRGLPQDISPEIKQLSDWWGIDGHSHSWLTVQELIEYDWEQTVVSYGVVTRPQYEEFVETGIRPDAYCEWIYGRNIEVVSPAEMEAIIADGADDDETRYYVCIRWSWTYREAVGDYVFDTLFPTLKALGDPDSVRIVFWFDN